MGEVVPAPMSATLHLPSPPANAIQMSQTAWTAIKKYSLGISYLYSKFSPVKYKFNHLLSYVNPFEAIDNLSSVSILK